MIPSRHITSGFPGIVTHSKYTFDNALTNDRVNKEKILPFFQLFGRDPRLVVVLI